MKFFIVTIPLPSPIKILLTRICVGIPSIQWTEEQNFNLTIHSLGEINESILWSIKENLEKIKISPFSITLSHIDRYQFSHTQGRIWLGVNASPAFSEFQKEIRIALKPFQAHLHYHSFVPYVTLAKYRHLNPSKFLSFMEANQWFYSPSFIVESFQIISIHDTPKRTILTEEENYLFIKK